MKFFSFKFPSFREYVSKFLYSHSIIMKKIIQTSLFMSLKQFLSKLNTHSEKRTSPTDSFTVMLRLIGPSFKRPPFFSIFFNKRPPRIYAPNRRGVYSMWFIISSWWYRRWFDFDFQHSISFNIIEEDDADDDIDI